MKNKAVNAPIKFEEIVKVMINRLIDRFYPCLSIGGTVNSELKILQKRSKKPLLRQKDENLHYFYLFLFCFVLEQTKSEERDFRFGQREK